MIKFIRNNLLYLLLALGISPLSSSVHGVNIKLPFLVIGILLLWIQKKNIRTIIINSFHRSEIKFITLLCFFMFGIGCVTGDNVLNVLLDFMAIMSFSLFFFMKLANRKDYYTLEDFAVRLSVAITTLEIVLIYFNIYEPGDGEHRIINLVICPFFLAMYYLSKQQIVKSFTFLSILVYMCVVSSMRVNFFFPIFYLIELIFIIFHNRQFGLARKMVILVSIVVSTAIVFPIAKAYIEDDHLRYINTVARIEALYQKDNDFDETARTGTIEAIMDNPLDFIIPQGLGWQNHIKKIQSAYRSKYNVLSSMDSNIMYCMYHFGLFFGLWFICSILYRMIKTSVGNFKMIELPLLEINNYILASVFLMFVLKSWIFVYFSFGIMYGILSAVSMNSSIKNNG